MRHRSSCGHFQSGEAWHFPVSAAPRRQGTDLPPCDTRKTEGDWQGGLLLLLAHQRMVVKNIQHSSTILVHGRHLLAFSYSSSAHDVFCYLLFYSHGTPATLGEQGEKERVYFYTRSTNSAQHEVVTTGIQNKCLAAKSSTSTIAFLLYPGPVCEMDRRRSFVSTTRPEKVQATVPHAR